MRPETWMANHGKCNLRTNPPGTVAQRFLDG